MTGTSARPDSPLLEVADVGRAFGARRAVSNVSFSLRAGDCLALFGPNGAGKTTLLRMLAGLLKPSAGGARVSGIELPGGPAARARVGLISHHTMLYEALTGRENVRFAARLHGIGDQAPVDAALDRMAMLARADAPVRSLSRGMQQRISIARATVHSPALVLADEPYNGLDESGARSLTSLLRALSAAGTTIILVTHNLSEGLGLATHAAIMKAGSFVSFDRTDAIEPTDYIERYRQSGSVIG
jgi:heme exporter protein A